MMQPTSFTSSQDLLISVARELISLTGGDDQQVPPYWCRTINEFSSKSTKLIVSKYNNTNHKSNQDFTDKITPEELRFPKIREQFIELYDLNVEDLDKPFLVEDENGRKKPNVEWLKIATDFEDGEFDEEDSKMIMALRENRGVRIVATECTPEEIRRGQVGAELPLGQILRAALYLDIVKGIKKPRYPYLVMYAIYNIFYHVIPHDRISPHIKETIDDIYDRRETLLEKEKGQIDSSMEAMKKTIAPLIGGNKASFDSIAGQIDAGVGDLTDDTIDQVTEQCHKAMAIFKSKGDKNKDLGAVIGDMIGGDADKVRDTMNRVGLHTGNIRALVDNMSTGAMTNEELMASIPSEANDIDKIIAGITGTEVK